MTANDESLGDDRRSAFEHQARTRPWTVTAEQYQAAIGVHQPWIAEISPMQMGLMSKRAKAQYQAKRAAEWSASGEAKNEWARAVMEAFNAARWTEDDAEATEDARLEVLRARMKAQADAFEKAFERASADNRVKANGLSVGSRVFSILSGRYGEVVKVSQKSARVRFPPEQPPAHINLPARMIEDRRKREIEGSLEQIANLQWLSFNDLQEKVAVELGGAMVVAADGRRTFRPAPPVRRAREGATVRSATSAEIAKRHGIEKSERYPEFAAYRSALRESYVAGGLADGLAMRSYLGGLGLGNFDTADASGWLAEFAAEEWFRDGRPGLPPPLRGQAYSRQEIQGILSATVMLPAMVAMLGKAHALDQLMAADPVVGSVIRSGETRLWNARRGSTSVEDYVRQQVTARDSMESAGLRSSDPAKTREKLEKALSQRVSTANYYATALDIALQVETYRPRASDAEVDDLLDALCRDRIDQDFVRAILARSGIDMHRDEAPCDLERRAVSSSEIRARREGEARKEASKTQKDTADTLADAQDLMRVFASMQPDEKTVVAYNRAYRKLFPKQWSSDRVRMHGRHWPGFQRAEKVDPRHPSEITVIGPRGAGYFRTDRQPAGATEAQLFEMLRGVVRAAASPPTGQAASEALARQDRQAFWAAIDDAPRDLYLTSTVENWGSGKRRGQGRRRGGMVMGAMSDAPRGKITYSQILGKADIDADERVLVAALSKAQQVIYAQSLAAGLQPEQAWFVAQTVGGQHSEQWSRDEAFDRLLERRAESGVDGPREASDNSAVEPHPYESTVLSVAWNAWLDDPSRGAPFNTASELEAIKRNVAQKKMQIVRVDKAAGETFASLTPAEAKRREVAETHPGNLLQLSWGHARPKRKDGAAQRYIAARLRPADKVLILDEATPVEAKKSIAWADKEGVTVAIDPGPTWIWTAKDREGRTRAGELDASLKAGARSEADARANLKEQRLEVVSIKKRSTPSAEQLVELGFERNGEDYLEVKQRYVHRPPIKALAKEPAPVATVKPPRSQGGVEIRERAPWKTWQVFEDASGANATLEADGLDFVVTYLGEIRARGIGARYDRATPPRKRDAMAKAERLFAERLNAETTPEWRSRNRELYPIEKPKPIADERFEDNKIYSSWSMDFTTQWEHARDASGQWWSRHQVKTRRGPQWTAWEIGHAPSEVRPTGKSARLPDLAPKAELDAPPPALLQPAQAGAGARIGPYLITDVAGKSITVRMVSENPTGSRFDGKTFRYTYDGVGYARSGNYLGAYGALIKGSTVEAPAETAKEPAPASAPVIVKYSSKDGITLSGPTKPVKDKISAARFNGKRFRWSGRPKNVWLVDGSRGADRMVVDGLAAALAAAGVPVRVEFEGEDAAAAVIPAGLGLDAASPLLSLDIEEARALLKTLDRPEDQAVSSYIRGLPIFIGAPGHIPVPNVPTYASYDGDRYVKESQWMERRRALGTEATKLLASFRTKEPTKDERAIAFNLKDVVERGDLRVVRPTSDAFGTETNWADVGGKSWVAWARPAAEARGGDKGLAAWDKYTATPELVDEAQTQLHRLWLEATETIELPAIIDIRGFPTGDGGGLPLAAWLDALGSAIGRTDRGIVVITTEPDYVDRMLTAAMLPMRRGDAARRRREAEARGTPPPLTGPPDRREESLLAARALAAAISKQPGAPKTRVWDGEPGVFPRVYIGHGDAYLTLSGLDVVGLPGSGARTVSFIPSSHLRPREQKAFEAGLKYYRWSYAHMRAGEYNDALERDLATSPSIETDPARVQEIRNSIAEGQMLLRAGTAGGRTVDQLGAIRRAVENDMAKIGESRLRGQPAAVNIKDVTPTGYGPETPAMAPTRSTSGSLFKPEAEGFALVGQRGTMGRSSGPEHGEQTTLMGVSMRPDGAKMAELAAERRATGPRQASTGPMFESRVINRYVSDDESSPARSQALLEATRAQYTEPSRALARVMAERTPAERLAKARSMLTIARDPQSRFGLSRSDTEAVIPALEDLIRALEKPAKPGKPLEYTASSKTEVARQLDEAPVGQVGEAAARAWLGNTELELDLAAMTSPATHPVVVKYSLANGITLVGPVDQYSDPVERMRYGAPHSNSMVARVKGYNDALRFDTDSEIHRPDRPKKWSVQNTRGKAFDRDVVEGLAAALRSAGVPARAEFDSTGLLPKLAAPTDQRGPAWEPINGARDNAMWVARSAMQCVMLQLVDGENGDTRVNAEMAPIWAHLNRELAEDPSRYGDLQRGALFDIATVARTYAATYPAAAPAFLAIAAWLAPRASEAWEPTRIDLQKAKLAHRNPFAPGQPYPAGYDPAEAGGVGELDRMIAAATQNDQDKISRESAQASGETSQIVVAWTAPDQEWDEKPYAKDLGALPTMIPTIKTFAAMWRLDGDDNDFAKAEAHARTLGPTARVYRFPHSVKYPLEAARERIKLEAASVVATPAERKADRKAARDQEIARRKAERAEKAGPGKAKRKAEQEARAAARKAAQSEKAATREAEKASKVAARKAEKEARAAGRIVPSAKVDRATATAERQAERDREAARRKAEAAEAAAPGRAQRKAEQEAKAAERKAMQSTRDAERKAEKAARDATRKTEQATRAARAELARVECQLRHQRERVAVASARATTARVRLQGFDTLPDECSSKAARSTRQQRREAAALGLTRADEKHAREIEREQLLERKLFALREQLGMVKHPPTRMLMGNKTLAVIPSAKGTPRRIPAQFVLVEAEGVIPSHDATTFNPRPDYPPATQERRYESSQAEQLKVMDIAKQMVPELVQNTNPGSIDGTPIMDQERIAISGNGRTMGAQRHYRSAKADAPATLRPWLISNAGQFGFSAAQVRSFERPLVMRMIEIQPSERARLVRDTNEPLTQRLGAGEEATAKARQLPADLLSVLRDADADKLEPGVFFTSSAAAPLVGALERSGYINRSNRTRLLSPSGGFDKGAASDLIATFSRMVVPGELPIGLRSLLDRSCLAWLVAAAAGSAWDFRRCLQLALAEYMQLTKEQACLAQWREQGTIGGGEERPTAGKPRAEVMLEIVTLAARKATAFAKIARTIAERSRSGGADMFGSGVDPVDALRDAARDNGIEVSAAVDRKRCKKVPGAKGKKVKQ